MLLTFDLCSSSCFAGPLLLEVEDGFLTTEIVTFGDLKINLLPPGAKEPPLLSVNNRRNKKLHQPYYYIFKKNETHQCCKEKYFVLQTTFLKKRQ